jgi:hypothetical protein
MLERQRAQQERGGATGGEEDEGFLSGHGITDSA